RPLLAVTLCGFVVLAQTRPVEHGRIEDLDGIRIVRVWGDAAERGRAHGAMLGGEIAGLIRAEYEHMFGTDGRLLDVGRASLDRLIDYPADVRAELGALFEGIRASGADLRLELGDRSIDLQDLLFVNAFDVFATLGCSGFTLWGEQVEGGGVLTTRNFDWPVSGRHIVDSTIVLVRHFEDGRAVATVGWPGYLGCVTGVNSDGAAAFLHVGSGEHGPPEPGSVPTATAASEVLRTATIDDLPAVAKRWIDETSPPSSYISRFVAPRLPIGRATPVAVFEAETRRAALRDRERPCVVTNDFFGDRPEDCSRYRTIVAEVGTCLTSGDTKLSVTEAWAALRAVDRSSAGFATLHSLVFRADPWVFELRVGTVDARGNVLSAVRANRRFALSREQLFHDPRK
ncbi:MAG: hypothetical protein KDB80_05350, partial [Planctomycetes bacterium]|nr:hypothetical protein [Planctomycetota bacterium]